MDYSKWDKFAAELSDSDDEEPGAPKVTSISQGSKVTIGPEGHSISATDNKDAMITFNKQEIKTAKKKRIDDVDDGDIRNGGVTSKGCRWRQDAKEVVIKVPVDGSLKARDLSITLTPDANMKRVLALTNRSTGVIVFAATLRFAVLENDGEDEAPLDWEIKQDSYSSSDSSSSSSSEEVVCEPPPRYVVITMQKKSPIPGAVHWWSHVFEGDPEIDVTTIADRKPKAGASSYSSSTPTFSENWEEAQRLFKEKMAAKNEEKVTLEF
jgi:hypothetical protein